MGRFKPRLTPEEALRIAAEANPDALPPIPRAAPADAATPGAGEGGAGAQLVDAGVAAPESAGVPAPPPAPLYDPNENSVLSHRYREASLMAIARAAKAKGMTQKQFLSYCLGLGGVTLHPADLGVRAPARRRMDEV